MVKTAFSSPETGFTVLRVQLAGPRAGVVSVVGEGLVLHDGEEATFTGAWVDSPRFGRQFRAASFLPVTPDTAVGVRRFLTSGLIKGLGETTAERLLEAFGADVFDALENRERDVARVKGIGKKRAATVCASYKEHRGYRDLLVFLQGHGIGPATAMRIHGRYGAHALDRVRRHPYRLAVEVKGIGFKTADRLALALGLDPQSLERAEAGVLYKLEEALASGHLFLPFPDLVRRTHGELRIPEATVADAVMHLDGGGRLHREVDALYLTELYELECRVAERLRLLSAAERPQRVVGLGKHLEIVRQKLGFALSDEQEQAVRGALTHRVMAITGGPGTGKTTLVKAVVRLARRLDLDLLLASPTGRASKRLAESTGEEARTIHRLLEWSPESGTFLRGASDPLECDLLLVDESSMIDMTLMDRLLEALPERGSLVLVGDADQLPSVGAGAVFRDLIASDKVPVVRLHHIYRQAGGSLIVESAHRILAGEMPQVPRAAEVEAGQDFFFVAEEDPARIVRMVKLLVSERIPKKFRFDPFKDIQVLAPMHRGTAGVANLNAELQALLNPGRGGLKLGDQELREGDKVMQLRNNYDKDVYNGDVGVVTALDPSGRAVVVAFDDAEVELGGEELSDLQLAYASSVHKAQGSEYPAVVVVLAREHFIMCQRNLLYTAVTRGKALTVVVGSRSAVARAVANDAVQQRNSRLVDRLRGALPSAPPLLSLI